MAVLFRPIMGGFCNVSGIVGHSHARVRCARHAVTLAGDAIPSGNVWIIGCRHKLEECTD